MRLQHRLLKSPPVLSVLSLLTAAAIWEVVGRADISFVLPPLSDVARTAGDVWPSERFQGAVIETLKTFSIAWPIAISSGVVVGVLMGRYRVLEWALETYVNVFLSLPLLALTPILFLLFGVSRTSLVVLVFLTSFFVVLINTSSGVRAVERQFEEMGRSFGASELRILLRIVIPGALPLMLAGIRIGTGRAIKGVIFGEQLMGFLGMGGLAQRYGSAFRPEELWVMIVTIGGMGLLAIELIRFVENRLLKMMPQGQSLGP